MRTVPGQINHQCRECGGELDAYVQPGFAAAQIPDKVFVTCWNEGCVLGGQTLWDGTYATLDIRAYRDGWLRRRAAAGCM